LTKLEFSLEYTQHGTTVFTKTRSQHRHATRSHRPLHSHARTNTARHGFRVSQSVSCSPLVVRRGPPRSFTMSGNVRPDEIGGAAVSADSRRRRFRGQMVGFVLVATFASASLLPRAVTVPPGCKADPQPWAKEEECNRGFQLMELDVVHCSKHDFSSTLSSTCFECCAMLPPSPPRASSYDARFESLAGPPTPARRAI
jgi:hypothetical protein